MGTLDGTQWKQREGEKVSLGDSWNPPSPSWVPTPNVRLGLTEVTRKRNGREEADLREADCP